MSRRSIIIVVAGVLAVALLAISSRFAIKREMAWVDGTTGSMRYQTRWTLGNDTPPRIEQSALDKWATNRGIIVVHDWRLVRGTLKNIWGRPIGFGHGSAPPIYSLREDIMASYVNNTSDEDLKAFIKTTQTGSEAEQNAAVANAINVGLVSMMNGD